MKKNAGITLIALIITIVILLILAGITITFMLGDNGILNKAILAGENYSEQAARERLEIALADLATDKATNSQYNETTFIDNNLMKENMLVEGDIVTVDGWRFEIDRSVPKIAKSIGKLEDDLPINNEITINAVAKIANDYVTSKIEVEITYVGEIVSITIATEAITIPTKIDGKYVVEKQVDKNGSITIIAKDEKGGQQTAVVTINEITEDMDIYTKEDLEIFRDKVNKGATFAGRTVRLMSDIDLQGSISNQWKTIGDYGTEGNHYFEGNFEGNSYSISNIYIASNNPHQGLFGDNRGTISELKLVSGMISIGSTSNVGGIAGTNKGVIQRCYNAVNISGADGNIGGITGYNGGKITDCYNVGNITQTGLYNVGGITGANNSAEVINCYNTGKIVGRLQIGGVTGASFNNNNKIPSIINCYNIGNVSGEGPYIGSIAAYNGMNANFPGGILENCYYLEGSSASGTGATYGETKNENSKKTSDELKSIAGELGQAFIEDTNIINNGYPILKWQQ